MYKTKELRLECAAGVEHTWFTRGVRDAPCVIECFPFLSASPHAYISVPSFSVVLCRIPLRFFSSCIMSSHVMLGDIQLDPASAVDMGLMHNKNNR